MPEKENEQDATLLPELPPKAMRVTMGAHVETVHGDSKHLRLATNNVTRNTQTGEVLRQTNKFTFFSDEPSSLGGDDQYPQPLTYIAAGVGF